MAGNVIPFPSGSGGFSTGIGSNPATQASQTSQAPAPDDAAAAQSPTVDQILARMGATLNAAKKAAVLLVERAAPGTVEVGLFNQYGIIQNDLAQLQPQLTGDSVDTTAVAAELDAIAQRTADFSAAVDGAVANTSVDTTAADELKRKRILIAAGVLGVAALGTGAYLVLRQPKRRRAIAGFFGFKTTTPPQLGAGVAGTRKGPKRKARKPKAKARGKR